MAEASSPYVVIVAGGVGTRLWPLSRHSRPKQFLNLFGKDNFIQIVYRRAQLITSPEKIFIVAPASYGPFLDQYIPEFPKQNFMAEPAKKGTTAAYGYTAVYIKQLDPAATLHVLAADDYLEDDARYHRMLATAQAVSVQNDAVVIYGAPPRYPNPGYGYVQVDRAKKQNQEGIDYYSVVGFHEKPPLEKAQEYQRQGDYFWHCFGFTVSVDKLLKTIAKYDPTTYQVLLEIEADLKLPARLEEFNLARHYAKLVESDIENKILENLDQPLFMVTMEDAWSDIGTWDHVFEIKSKTEKSDENGNFVMNEKENAYFIGAKNNLVFAGQKPLALVGVTDLVVVETDEVTLVCSRREAQAVKQMVNLLKEKRPDLV